MKRTINFALWLTLLAICAGRAHAATLYVTEFQGAPPLSVYYQAARAPAQTQQAITFTVASVQSAAFGTLTGMIRIQCTVICNVTVGGTNPTATTSTMRLLAGQTEYFLVIPGDKIAVITGS